MFLKLLFASATLFSLASCGSSHTSKSNTAMENSGLNTLTSAEKKEGWKLLFDGNTTNGWHNYGKSTIGSAWKVSDGALQLDTTGKSGWQVSNGGDILSNESFENFHLKVEWKIAPNGNSGIIFDINEDPAKYKYPWESGPEMQVLDNNGHPDAKIHKHRAGDLYDLIACTKETVKPAGEWNLAEIIQNRGKLELKLNGETVVTTNLWDDNWKQLIAGSKFKSMPDFGTFKSGKIALQDHGDNVWYRNIKIKSL